MSGASEPLSGVPGDRPDRRADHHAGRRRVLAALATYRIWPVLLVLMLGAAIASGGIVLRPSNLVAILFIAAPTTIASLGQTLVILTAGIDLSVAATWVLAAVIAAGLAADGWSLAVSVVAALGIGAAGGLVNGLLVALLRVPPLITTLGTLSIGEGIARVYTGNSPILSVPPAYKALGGASFGPLPLPTLILITVTLLLVFVMHRMAIGRQIHAVGGNATAARYAGLPVAATLIFVYTASGVLAALAGLLQSAYVQEALPNVDMNMLFATIGGVVVGGTSLMGGRGRLINSVGGVLVIVVVQNMMNILGVSPLLAEGVLGFIVLIAVYLNIGFNPRAMGLWLTRVAAR
jgi:ribose/xylose/arabinose/galactoside ABC-type transport system permease subunit